ncbi:annetocin receptor-like [Mytilus galloprovincialis]|uniref:annetocin receptor-like n=1 Tax=Mytilus galloprovincialis TaxID=29158 RepID=UPI003F7CD36D
MTNIHAFTNSSQNNTSIKPLGRNEELAKIEISTLAVLLYFSLFGNTVVLFVLKFKCSTLTRMQWFIFHLCIADLSMGFFNLLPQMAWDITYRFQGNDFLCKFVKYFQVVAMYASSYVLVTTAIDRYVSICYPITSQTWTNKRIHCMISLAWIMSLLCAVPQLVLFSYQETESGSDVYDCWENLSTGPIWKLQIYVTWIFVSIYFVPFCILTAVYSRICYVVWISVGSSSNLPETKRYPRKISFNKTYSVRDSNAENAMNKPRVHRKAVSNSKLKTIKLTLAVILCYLLCWGPFFVAQIWSAYDFNAPFTHSAMVVILLLSGLNSCVNPWLFLAFSGRMCTKVKLSSRQSAYTFTTGTESDGRYRSPSIKEGNSAVVKLNPQRTGSNLLVRNSRF